MPDKYSPEVRRSMMQSVKAKGSKIENLVCKSLWKNGIRYRKNVKSLKGCPDISIKKYKLVIFIDSCFWHGCNEHCRMPKSNIEFWENKIIRNKARDKDVTEFYETENWNVLRIWEHDLKKDKFIETLQIIVDFVLNSKKLKC